MFQSLYILISTYCKTNIKNGTNDCKNQTVCKRSHNRRFLKQGFITAELQIHWPEAGRPIVRRHELKSSIMRAVRECGSDPLPCAYHLADPRNPCFLYPLLCCLHTFTPIRCAPSINRTRHAAQYTYFCWINR